MVYKTVIVGEVANFVAYAFAPAVLVTPLGALSIIVRYFSHLQIQLLLPVIANIFPLMSGWLSAFVITVQVACCSAVLAHFFLREKLHRLGILGCVMCIAGSVIIVIHAPQEQSISSVQEICSMATQPGK